MSEYRNPHPDPHYDYKNMPMQYTEIFSAVKNENFQQKNFDIFLIFFLKPYVVGIR